MNCRKLSNALVPHEGLEATIRIELTLLRATGVEVERPPKRCPAKVPRTPCKVT